MHAGREFQRRYRRRIDVDQAEWRMVGHEVAATALAKLTVARFRLHELADVLGALGHAHVLRLPQSESGDRRGRPGTAGRAMAVAHCFSRAGHLDFHGAAEALALVRGHFGNSCWIDEP